MRGHYYSNYVNHMWNLFVSSPDAVPSTANEIDRSDWNICKDVFSGLRTLERNLIFARHNPNRSIRESAFRECYENAGLSEQNASIIISIITDTVAVKRGLIAPRKTMQQTT